MAAEDFRMQIWALGNYQRVAELIAGMGPDLVAAAGVRPGHRVLDVGCGTGNAAIPAAKAGGAVTAADLTPQLLAIGRQLAGDLPIDWVEADAEDLPFDDATFDVVLSCVGAMFAADHKAAARELVRVCRPGGLVASATWPPDGGAGRFLQFAARHSPAPAAGPSPLLWGDPVYVRELFGGLPVETAERVVELDFTGTPGELAELYLSAFPVLVAIRAALDGDAARAEFDNELRELLTAENEGPPGGPGRWRFPWLLTLVRKP